MKPALDGIKVCDFSWVGAGPRATKDLADHGATVVKIESRARLDLGRLSPPFAGSPDDPDGSAFFAQTNSGKRSVTLNLADPRAVAIAGRLIAWADLVVENFSRGFLDRLGLSWPEMQALNPRVILLSVSVAGRVGPLSAMRGYGNSAAALSGQASLAGWDGDGPHMPPFAYGDVVAPLYATLAALAALEHRARTGQGQHVDISQVEPLMHTMSDCFAAATLDSHPASRNNRHSSLAPHGIFPARGPDQWCAIVAGTQAQFASLCAALGAPTLATDPRFATEAARKTHEDALEAALAPLTRNFDKHCLAASLRDLGVPAAAVQDGRDVFTDPALIEAGHFVRLTHPVLGTHDMPAPPVRLSRHSVTIRPSPCLGADTARVLAEFLAIPEAEIAALAAQGVLA